MGALVRIVSSATSFRPTLVLTSRAARSVVSMIRWMAATSHSTSRVASLNEYFLLASSGRRPIQNRLHRKVVETNGAESSCEAISPRWMKICSSSVIPVDWPAVASVGTCSTLKASTVLPVADQVHLVDNDGHLPDAEQGEEVAVLLGLLLHALVGVDHQERCLGARRAGDHVLQELLVARRVNDDVVAALPLEERAGGVDRDALLLFLQESVEEESVLELLALPAADFPNLVELAVGGRAGVGVEPAQQRGLAVIHVADDNDVQMLTGGRRAKSGGRPCTGRTST